MKDRENVKQLTNRFIFIILGIALVALIGIYVNVSDKAFATDASTLFMSTLTETISVISIAFVVLITYKMFILPKIEALDASPSSVDQQLKNMSSNIDELLAEKKEVGFSKSNKTYFHEIFAHYFNEKNNCLDFIALCDEDHIIGYQVHPDFENRLRSHNVKTNAQTQADEYRSLANEYTRILSNISDELNKIDQGSLKKIAFDVEVGGIFYYIFNKKKKEKTHYLFGATVDQKAMEDGLSYREMEDIFEEVNRKV